MRIVAKSFIGFVLFVVLLSASKSYAQLQPNFVHFQIENGLQSNTIYNLHIAKNGLLYIAHTKGLSSFDGNNFVNYYHKERPFTEVTNIMETVEGEIFCRAFNNVLYRKVKDSLRWFVSVIPYSYGFAPSAVFQNDVYSITNDSIIIFDAKQSEASSIPLNTSVPLPSNEEIKFIAWSKLNGKPTLFALNDKRKLFHFVNAKGVFHYKNGDIFFVKNKKEPFIEYYNQREQLNINNFKENSSINYVCTTDSIIWVCTTNGLYYRNKFSKTDGFNHILQEFDISDVKQTKEGNYFISTLGQGLLFVPNFKVNKISNVPQNITFLTGWNNSLFLATKENGLIEHDIKTNKNELILNPESGNAIKLVYKNAKSNTIFLAGNYSYINKKKYGFIIKDVSEVGENLLLSTNDGLYLYALVKNNHWINQYIIPNPNNDIHLKKLSFSNEHTSNAKYNSKTDNIYISNYTGLLEMAKGYKDYKKLPEPNCVLKDICVWKGELLLASKDRGVLKWTGKNYEAAFPEKQTNGILYKFETYKNELWILGEEAVFCYKNDSLYTYNNQIGINAENFRGLYISEKDVFANNGNSIIHFSKEKTKSNDLSPSFILNKVINVYANKEIQQNAILPFNENFISFRFYLIAYANAKNTHVAYSINNKDIVHLPSDRREVNLDFLKADDYNIEFYIVTNGITPLQPIAKFSFSIKPPFYKTWWFYIIGLICIGSFVYYLARRKITKERSALALKESKLLLEKELDKTTLSSIKAQMNPHFIFNALNTIQSYVYLNDKKNASIYISKFSDLTRSILDMSNKETINLQEEVNALDLYLSLEKMRFEESFDYSIIVQEDLEKDKIELPSMLIQPYVENAVKHGLLHRKTNRAIQINFEIEDKFLIVTVDDNGIGRKKSEALKTYNQRHHTSFAMEANKKRLDILLQQHKEIYLEIIDKYSPQNEALGTKVIIKLPIRS